MILIFYIYIPTFKSKFYIGFTYGSTTRKDNIKLHNLCHLSFSGTVSRTVCLITNDENDDKSLQALVDNC